MSKKDKKKKKAKKEYTDTNKKEKSKKKDNKKSKKSKKSKKKNCRDTELYFRRNAMEYSESNSSDYDDDLYFRHPLNTADVKKSFFSLLFG
jgi:hypothetical protein